MKEREEEGAAAVAAAVMGIQRHGHTQQSERGGETRVVDGTNKLVADGQQ